MLRHLYTIYKQKTIQKMDHAIRMQLAHLENTGHIYYTQISEKPLLNPDIAYAFDVSDD